MKTNHLIVAFFAFFAITLISCSESEENVLTSIPADTGMIVRLNADKFLTSAGAQKDGNTWKFGQGIENILATMTSGTRSEFMKLMDALPVLDYENIYVYEYKSSPIATCITKHPGALADGLEKELGKPHKIDGYSVYNHVIILKGNRVWIAENIDKLMDSLEDAAKSPASNVDIISNADLSSLRDFHKEMNADVTLLTSGRESSRRLLFDVQNNLRGWHNRNTGEFRPETSASLSGLTEHAFSGIYMVSAHGVADIRRYARESGREAFPVMDWLLAGRGGVTIKEHYVPELELIDIGKPETLAKARLKLG